MSRVRCLWSSANTIRAIFVDSVLPHRIPASSSTLPSVFPIGLPRNDVRGYVVRRVLIRNPEEPSPIKIRYGDGHIPRNNEIPYDFVVVRNPDGKLSEPQVREKVVASLNRKVDDLVLVAPPSQGGSGGGTGLPYPICKIVNRQAESAAKAERQQAARKKTVNKKELEINWAIDPHDLEHRLERLKTFLEKGIKVDVTLMRKRGKTKRASDAEGADVVRKIKETINGVAGAKLVKSTGPLLGTMIISAEGPHVAS